VLEITPCWHSFGLVKAVRSKAMLVVRHHPQRPQICLLKRTRYALVARFLTIKLAYGMLCVSRKRPAPPTMLAMCSDGFVAKP